MTNEKAKLKFGEIKKLQKILDKSHEIHGKGNFPTITVEPTKLIKVKFENIIMEFPDSPDTNKRVRCRTIGASLVKIRGRGGDKSCGCAFFL